MKKKGYLISFAAAAAGAGLIFLTMQGCRSDKAKPSSTNLGSVDSTVRWFSPDDRIDVDYLKDPDIDGITIYVSKAEKGGMWSYIGMQEDTSDISIATRQTGPIVVKNPINDKEEVFSESRSPMFKNMHITRFWHPEEKTFVYLVHSKKLIDGSPKNSISVVTAKPWEGQEPNFDALEPTN